MKKLVFSLFMIVVSIVSLCACSGDSEENILKEPPELTVTSDKTSFTALKGTYSWQYPNGAGNSVHVEADSPHPLECKEYFEPLETTGTTATLEFSVEPDTILSVQCWSDEHWDDYSAIGEDVMINGNEIELKSGGYIYEVRAEWNTENGYGGGIAYYSFYLQ